MAELISYLKKEEGRHVTVSEISDYFTEKGISVGTTTIYRNLEKMVEEGIVAGGGVALVRAATKVATTLKGDNEEQDVGIKLALRAMEAPLRQIVTNAGEEASVVASAVKNGEGNFGYNAGTEQYGDMIEMGILDPTKVTRSALQFAASVAGLMITTECMVTDLPKDDKADLGAAGMGGMGGMGGMM